MIERADALARAALMQIDPAQVAGAGAAAGLVEKHVRRQGAEEAYIAVAPNLAGIPGISVPCGLSTHGLPVGFQLMAPHWGESTIFRLAHAYEQAHPLTERPSVIAEG